MVEQETEPQLARDPRQRRERGPQGGRDRLRPGRPFRRLLPGPPGLQAGGLRGRAACRRHAGAGHPGLPPAARGARPRGQDDRRHGRALRVRQGPGPRLHAPEPQGRGLRGRVRRRRRPAGHGHRRARRGRPGRVRRPVVPQAVQPRGPGPRGQARGGHRRRQRSHRRRPHRPAPRRRERSRSSTAAPGRRCRRGARRSTPPTSRASTS